MRTVLLKIWSSIFLFRPSKQELLVENEKHVRIEYEIFAPVTYIAHTTRYLARKELANLATADEIHLRPVVCYSNANAEYIWPRPTLEDIQLLAHLLKNTK